MQFLPDTAATQAPLHDILSRPRIKGSHPINWTPDLDRAFKECKMSLSSSTLLVHPDPKRKEIIGGCNPNVGAGCDTRWDNHINVSKPLKELFHSVSTCDAPAVTGQCPGDCSQSRLMALLLGRLLGLLALRWCSLDEACSSVKPGSRSG
jgi:hypothetical protein